MRIDPIEKIILTELPSEAALKLVKVLNTEGIIQQRAGNGVRSCPVPLLVESTGQDLTP